LKKLRFIFFVPGIFWFLLVLVLICLPKSDLPPLEGWGALLEKIHFDKWVHAGIFGIMAMLFYFPFGKTNIDTAQKNKIFILISLLAIGWGFVTECIQIYVPGRSFDLADWAADSFGICIFWWYAHKIWVRN
jgi:hypothetical protein